MNERPWNKPPAKAEKVAAEQMKGVLAVADHIQRTNAALIDELAQVRDAKSKLEKREKEIVDALKALGAGEHNGTKVIAVITTDDRETFDSKAFKSDHPDVAAKYLKTSSVTTIRIKPLI